METTDNLVTEKKIESKTSLSFNAFIALLNEYKFINLDDFYNIGIGRYNNIIMQGEMSSEKIAKYGKEFKFEPEENGFLVGRKIIEGIRINIALT